MSGVCATLMVLSWGCSSIRFCSGHKTFVSYHDVCDAIHYILVNIVIPCGSPGRVAQSETCLTVDTCLIADPRVASSIAALFHTFVEIDCTEYQNKGIDIVTIVKHFLLSTTDTQYDTVKPV